MTKKLLAFSVKGKSCSVSVLHKNLVTIVQSISETQAVSKIACNKKGGSGM
jgi:hypothetical protein